MVDSTDRLVRLLRSGIAANVAVGFVLLPAVALAALPLELLWASPDVTTPLVATTFDDEDVAIDNIVVGNASTGIAFTSSNNVCGNVCGSNLTCP